MRTDLNNELEKCKTPGSTCRITGEFSEAVKINSSFIKSLKLQIDTIPLAVARTTASQLIQKEVIEPVNECLVKLENIHKTDNILIKKVDEVFISSDTLMNKINYFFNKFGNEFNTKYFKSSIVDSVMNDTKITHLKVLKSP